MWKKEEEEDFECIAVLGEADCLSKDKFASGMEGKQKNQIIKDRVYLKHSVVQDDR